MKLRDLAVLTGVSTPMILGGSADAAYLGIKVVGKQNEFGLLVCNVYAMFDRPGEDTMVAVAGTPDQQLTVEVLGGTFYQHPFGGDVAPSQALVDSFPSLAFDTFVTIGEKVDVNSNAPTLTPTWPGFGDTLLRITGDGWAVTPNNPLGDPFNPDTPGADGQVLIAQFSTADGTAISGTMLLTGFSNGAPFEAVESFFHVPNPGSLALIGAAGLVGTRRRRRR